MQSVEPAPVGDFNTQVYNAITWWGLRAGSTVYRPTSRLWPLCRRSERRGCLSLIIRAPSFPLGKVSCLDLDRSSSRKSVTTIFTLFRGSFEAVFLFFWWLVGRRYERLNLFFPGPTKPIPEQVLLSWSTPDRCKPLFVKIKMIMTGCPAATVSYL